MNENIKIGFFGTPEYASMTLEKLHGAGFAISCIVTVPDAPKGRKNIITPPDAKIWGRAHDIPVLQPSKLSDPAFIEDLKKYQCDVFVVMAYGKIIPEAILNIPKAKTLNLHPSLLPKFRGPCPIEGAILANEKETGVTIMRLDKEMDHGPIVTSKKVVVEPWPPIAEELGRELVDVGSDLLVSMLPDWVAGKMPEMEQDHAAATYTSIIKKEDGLIDLSGDPFTNYLKIQAYHGWPSAYFFAGNGDKKIRVKVTQASFAGNSHDGKLTIEKVIPEGKKEMNYSDFVKNSAK